MHGRIKEGVSSKSVTSMRLVSKRFRGLFRMFIQYIKS